MIKNLPVNAGGRRDADSIPRLARHLGVRKWQPIPVFLLGKFHGQRSLVVYNPQGQKELHN